MIENAPTFLDDVNDPGLKDFDLRSITDFLHPVLLTQEDQSPPFYSLIIARLVDALPCVEVVSYPGAGHTPHNTHPDAYIKVVTSFIHRQTE